MADMTGRSIAVRTVWDELQGTWKLHRKLNNTYTAESSGRCTGSAEFAARRPSLFVDGEGFLQTATAEMLYTEKGDFTMQSAGSAVGVFPFSRRYVWRLQDKGITVPEITVWFVKPGTDEVDYLFHKFSWQSSNHSTDKGVMTTVLDFTGGHLCVEDFYSSQYTFHLTSAADDGVETAARIRTWEMVHEIRGPKKDQLLVTQFERQ